MIEPERFGNRDLIAKGWTQFYNPVSGYGWNGKFVFHCKRIEIFMDGWEKPMRMNPHDVVRKMDFKNVYWRPFDGFSLKKLFRRSKASAR